MTKTHFPPLDGLRGLAILLVLFVHTYDYAGPAVLGRVLDTLAEAGWTGVTAFFVLSGFLITGILIDTRGQPHYLRDFYARRSLRVLPLHYAFLIVYFLVVPLMPFASERLPLPPAGTSLPYWTYTTNMRGFLTGHYLGVPTLDPLWSLAVEEQVYLFWPLLILLVPSRRLGAVLVGLATLSFAWRLGTRWTRQPLEVSYEWMPAALEAFAVGGLVAHLIRVDPPVVRLWAPRIAAGAATLLLGFGVSLGHFSFWRDPLWVPTVGLFLVSTLFAALIGWSVTAATANPLNRILATDWLRSVGKYSYAMYLIHQSMFNLMEPGFYSRQTGLVPHQDPALELLFTGLVAAASYAVARLTWRFCEEPFLKLKRFFPLSGGVPRVVVSPAPVSPVVRVTTEPQRTPAEAQR